MRRLPIKPRAAAACADRHHAFVDGLDRARRRTAAAPSASLVLRRITRLVVRRTANSIRQALNLTIRNHLTTLTSAPARAAAGPARPARDTIRLLRQQVSGREVRSLREQREARSTAAPALDRLQTLRHFAQTHRSHTSRIEHEARPVSAPLRILLRQGPALPAVEARRGSPNPESPSPRDDRTPAPSKAFGWTPSLPPQDLALVTEHVIDRLNQRARSLRERFGHI